MDGFCDTLRFIPVERFRPTCGNCTKATTSCTDIPEDHESGRASTPAFTHIWAVSTFTNCMKLVGVHKVPVMFIFFANWKLLGKPGMLFITRFNRIIYYWKFGHLFC